jgi:hypothetical protein
VREYVELVERVRLTECSKQIQHILKGLSHFVPIRVIFLFCYERTKWDLVLEFASLGRIRREYLWSSRCEFNYSEKFLQDSIEWIGK